MEIQDAKVDYRGAAVPKNILLNGPTLHRSLTPCRHYKLY